MNPPINLNKARKAKARADDAAQAKENRVRFGLNKGERMRQKLDAARATRALDGQAREQD